MDKYLEAQKRLAELLGWTGIFESGGSLIGTPPDGGKNSRGQAMVPQWCSDWNACGPLMVRHGCYPKEHELGIECGAAKAALSNHTPKEVAAMYVIVMIVIAKLERCAQAMRQAAVKKPAKAA